MAKKKVKITKKEKKVPLGVRLISILYYFSVMGLFFYGLINLTNGLGWTALNTSVPGLMELRFASSILVMLIGVVGFFVTYNFNEMRNWARVVIILLSILSIVDYIFTFGSQDSLFLLIWNMVFIVFDVLIIFYLFNKKVKEVFK
jgi:hypothetical protein